MKNKRFRQTEQNRATKTEEFDAEETLRNRFNKGENIPYSASAPLSNAAEITPREMAFCNRLIETGDTFLAYRETYSAHKTADDTILKETGRLLAKPGIRRFMAKAREYGAYAHGVTVQTQANKLQKVYEESMRDKKYAAAVQAVMGQCKLYGLIHDADQKSQVVNVNMLVDRIRDGRTRMRVINPHTPPTTVEHNA